MFHHSSNFGDPRSSNGLRAFTAPLSLDELFQQIVDEYPTDDLDRQLGAVLLDEVDLVQERLAALEGRIRRLEKPAKSEKAATDVAEGQRIIEQAMVEMAIEDVSGDGVFDLGEAS